MSLEEEKQSQEAVRGLLNKDHKEELGKILAFGEKYKAEGERMKEKFWSRYKIDKHFDDRQIFFNLIGEYHESKCKFERGLLPEERKLLDSLNGTSKNKFYEMFLFDRILYSGDSDIGHLGMKEDLNGYSFLEPGSLETIITWMKREFKPLFKAEFHGANIGVAGAELLAKEWKGRLKPGMQIILTHSKIGAKGVELLARGWKDSLHHGMVFALGTNYFGVQGIKAIAKEWKNSLQVGMKLDLSWNDIGNEGVEILAKERKGKLQPGMILDLSYNYIGNEGLKHLAEERKGVLPPGFVINLTGNDISDEGVQYIMDNWELNGGVKINLLVKDGYISEDMKGKLKKWVEGYKNKGVNCDVIV